MERAVDIIIEISVYSTLVAAGILLFRAVFGKRISPRVQYMMWFLLILRLMLPVTFESGFHIPEMLPEIETPAVIDEQSASEAPVAAIPMPIPDTAPIHPPVSEAEVEVVTDSIVPQAPTVEAAPPQVYEPPTTQQREPLPWRTTAFTVWIVGIVAYALWMTAVKLKYYEAVQQSMSGLPRRAYEIYGECCKELAVTPITIWPQNRAISPGIAFFSGAVLLIPVTLNEEALRYAFLHELTHKKRGDHYVTALLNVLRAVYWFSPVVHICFNEIRSDMETACDADVIAFIGREQKRGYLTTILELFSYDVKPQLGMSQISSKRMAARRMKGAFMRSSTTLLGRAGAGLMAAAMLICCFTTACQSAPASDAPKAGTDGWQSIVVDEVGAYTCEAKYLGIAGDMADGVIAVNPEIFPLGTEFYIEGYGYGRAEDHYRNYKSTPERSVIELWMDSHDKVKAWETIYNADILYRLPESSEYENEYALSPEQAAAFGEVYDRLYKNAEEILYCGAKVVPSGSWDDGSIALLDELGLMWCGAGASGGTYLSCTANVQESPCSPQLCYLYAAAVFAASPDVQELNIGNQEYVDYISALGEEYVKYPDNAMGYDLLQEDVEKYYYMLDKRLAVYGMDAEGFREMLDIIAENAGIKDGGAEAAPIEKQTLYEAGYSGSLPLRSTHTITYTYPGDPGEVIEGFVTSAERMSGEVTPEEKWSFKKRVNPDSATEQRYDWNTARSVMIVDSPLGMRISASTLYAALLAGDVTVTERRGLAWAADYAPAGLEVGISGENDGLCFVNDTGKELYIACSAYMERPAGGACEFTYTVDIYGEPLPEGVSYSLRSETVSAEPMPGYGYRDDPSMPRGMESVEIESRAGSTVELYRDTVVDGKVAESELIGTERYRSVQGLISRGTKQPVTLSTMERGELFELSVELYRSVGAFDSKELTLSETYTLYTKLCYLLDIGVGGLDGGNGSGTALTAMVYMEDFDRQECMPYAALIFAMDKNASQISFPDTGDEGGGTFAVFRENLHEYFPYLVEPIEAYAESQDGIYQLLLAVCGKAGASASAYALASDSGAGLDGALDMVVNGTKRSAIPFSPAGKGFRLSYYDIYISTLTALSASPPSPKTTPRRTASDGRV